MTEPTNPTSRPGISPHVQQEFDDLILDAIETVRNMLDHGDTPTRESAIRMIPQIQKMMVEVSGKDEGSREDAGVTEARRLLAEMWQG